MDYKIDKEYFFVLIEECKEQDRRLDILNDAGLQVWDSDVFEYGALMFEKVLNLAFTEEGVDWISWWLWEKTPQHKAYYENGEEIPTETVEDLWELVKEYRK